MADVQRSAGPARVGQQKKSLRRPVEREPLGFVGIVRVVGFKFPAAFRLRDAEQHDAMVDGHRWEFHQMENRQTVLFQRGGQRLGGAQLMGTREGDRHSPVTPQKIRAPRRAAFGFAKWFLRPAECTQPGITGNHDLLAGFAWVSRVTGDDGTDELPVDVIGRHRLFGLEPGVIKELPSHAGKCKTAMGVLRFGLARAENPFTRRRVHPVFPYQFVGESESVACEFKASPARFS